MYVNPRSIVIWPQTKNLRCCTCFSFSVSPLLGGFQPIGFVKLWNEAKTSSLEKPAWAETGKRLEEVQWTYMKTHKIIMSTIWNFHLCGLCQHSIIIPEVWLKHSEIACNTKTRSEKTHMFSSRPKTQKFKNPAESIRCFRPPILFQIEMIPTNATPLKINMEHNHGGLEDDFPFQIGDF